MIELTSSRVCLILWYASFIGILSSITNLSSLLMTTTISKLALSASFICLSVWKVTPSMQSTTRSMPSASLIPVVTSSEKFGCPGVSIMLNSHDFSLLSYNTIVIGDALILSFRSTSSFLLSVHFISLFKSQYSLLFELWVWWTNMSHNSVFPWCKCPATTTFLINWGLVLKPERNSRLKLVSGISFSKR